MPINFPGVPGGMSFVPNMPPMGPIGMMPQNPIMAQNKGLQPMMVMGNNVPQMGGMMGVVPPQMGQIGEANPKTKLDQTIRDK